MQAFLIINCGSALLPNHIAPYRSLSWLCFDSAMAAVRQQGEAQPKRSKTPTEQQPNQSRTSLEAIPKQCRTTAEQESNSNRTVAEELSKKKSIKFN
ncbi:hypothetical protein [Sphingobacterium nematocida]|uniref:hypothetical protein n=1 Tax=Sphingobacterium nematocida TaxID=1513896 RepID=UPI00111673AA|nr:hypothetical protein [Sphingobacterium nematocida]